MAHEMRYRPCIVSGVTSESQGSRVWLPPVSAGPQEWRISNESNRRLITPVAAHGKLRLAEYEDATRISLRGTVIGLPLVNHNGIWYRDWSAAPTAATAWAIYKEILDATSPRNGPFWLFRWATHAWRQCSRVSASRDLNAEPDAMFDFSLEIEALDPREPTYATWGTDRDEANEPALWPLDAGGNWFDGTWDLMWTRMSGITPGVPEGGEERAVKDYQTLSFFLDGQPQVTPTGYEIKLPVVGIAGRTYRVTKISLSTLAPVVGTTSTIIKASNAGIGGAGDEITLTLPYTAYRGDQAGSSDVLVGAYVYVWVTQSGAHSALSGTVHIEEV